MNRRILSAIAACAGLMCQTDAFATVFRVDASNSSLTQNGTSWATSFKYLQDALAAAALDTSGVPHTIRVAQGVYHPDHGGGQTTGDRDAVFSMLTDVTIEGGYRGLAGLPIHADDRNIATYVTILSGDLTDDDTWPNANGLDQTARETNSKQVVRAWSVANTAKLDGVIVSDAESFDDDDTSGGGISVNFSPAQFANCTIRRCRVSFNHRGRRHVCRCKCQPDNSQLPIGRQ